LSSGDKVYPLTHQTAVLVNGWQPHSYVHDPERPRTVILALYIEAGMADGVSAGLWRRAARPDSSAIPSGDVSPRIRGLAMNLAADMMARPEARGAHEAALSDLMIAVIERFHAVAKFSGFDPEMNTTSGDCASARLQASMRAETRRGVALDTLARKRACRGRTCFGCSNPRSACREGLPERRCAWSRRSTLCSINQQAWATLANSSALLSRRISRASSAIMLASARASSGISPVLRADAALHISGK